MLWGTTVPLVPDLGFPRKDKGRGTNRDPVGQSHRRQPAESYPQIFRPFPHVDSAVDNSGQGLRSAVPALPWNGAYFHWVETPKPAAMKPKPTTMFQLPSGSIGSLPSVT